MTRATLPLLARSAAAAATVILFTLGSAACDDSPGPGTDADGDGGPTCTGIDCSTGPAGIDPVLYDECCCADVCCECDYGVPPPGCCDGGK
jgi:hypothetical protein